MARPRAKKELQPIKFVAVERAFKPQVKVRATRDMSGWVNRDRRVKWSLASGAIGCIDEDRAREFQAKGYVEILDGTVKPVSEDEAAELLSTVTVVGL